MRTLKLTIAYDGTHFAGWQRQPHARTVQQTIEETLQKITGSKVTLIGAGRTDTGVHADGQVAHLRLNHPMPTGKLLRALNATLPEDVAIRSIHIAPAKFHAQYDASAKRYRYTLWNKPTRPMAHRERMLHVSALLDLKTMRQAANLLKGRHDFKAFYTDGRLAEDTRRTLRSLTVRSEKNGMIQIIAEADGFLYHMVRRIVGLLLDIGKGKHPPTIVREILRGRGSAIAHTAPAKGLCLTKVIYRHAAK